MVDDTLVQPLARHQRSETSNERGLTSKQRTKDVSDFVRVTRPYHERLFRIALTLCHDRDQAADLTQEALIRAFKAFDRFRSDAPVLPWLARIVRNVYLDTLKTGRAQYEVAEHQVSRQNGSVYEGRPSATHDPLATLERSRMASMLKEEIAALEEPQRIVLVLCDIEGLSYQEASEVADVPVGTVRSRLSRCRAYLRQRLQQRMTAEQAENNDKSRNRLSDGTFGKDHS